MKLVGVGLERLRSSSAALHVASNSERTVDCHQILGEELIRLHQFEVKAAEHQTLLQRIPNIKDLQCAWFVLLHCARVNFFIQTVSPSL